LDIVQDVARQNHLVRVTKVSLCIGRFAGVELHALQFAWQVLREGTLAAEAGLEIEEVPVVLRCGYCESEYVTDLEDMSCPLCDSLEYEVIGGRELNLKSVYGETADAG
jgi:hydrogenase nickel incorporation protein HypA/HybF